MMAFQNFTIKNPMIIDKEPNINYFLPDPDHDNDKRVNADIKQQLQRDFKDVFIGIGCFDGTFLLCGKTRQQTTPGIPEIVRLCTATGFQRGVRMTPTARHHNTPRHG